MCVAVDDSVCVLIMYCVCVGGDGRIVLCVLMTMVELCCVC